MRKSILIAGGVLVALIAAAAAYVLSLDVNQYRPQIQASIQKQLGRQVTLGDMGLHLFPLSIRVEGVAIAEDPAFQTGRQFVSAREVRVAVSLLPLLRKQIRVDSFILREPQIELVRDGAGKWNFSSLGSGAAAANQPEPSSGGVLTIGELRVENGSLAVGDLGKSRSVYRNINITLKDFAPGSPLRLEAAASLPDNGGAIRFNAAGGPLETQQPVTGRIEIDKAAIGSLRKFMSEGSAPAEGNLNGAIDFTVKGRTAEVRPRLMLENPKIGGKSIGRNVSLEGDLQHNLDTGILHATSLRAVAGNVPVSVTGDIDTRKSAVDVTVRASNAPLADLLALAAAFGASAMEGSGTLTLDAHIRGPLDNMSQLEVLGSGSLRDASLRPASLKKPVQIKQANLKLSGKEAGIENLALSLGSSNLSGGVTVRDFASPSAAFDLNVDRLDVAEIQSLTESTPAAKSSGGQSKPSNFRAQGKLGAGTLLMNGIVMNDVRADCTFAGGILTLSPITAKVFGGMQSGGITVDMRKEPATVALNTKFNAVDANQLITATTSLKNAIYGALAASGDASMKTLPGAEGVRTLNGKLSLNLTNGKIGGINIMNELSSLGKFAGLANNAQPFTNLLSLTGDMLVRDGVATSDNLMMKLEGGGSMAAAGSVNLADETVNMKVTAVLGREMSQRAGGNRIGGYLTTALVNNQGEIVIPAIVTGSFAKPRFAPDAARMAEMKLKNVLPSAGGLVEAVTGKGGAKSILQSITGGAQAQAPAQPAAPGATGTTEQPKKKGLFDALKGIQDKVRTQTQQPAPQK